MTQSPLIFCFDRVSVQASVGTALLLKEVSLQVAVGDRLAIVGPSGSGKTTLLRLFNRLQDPTAGTLMFRDSAIATQAPVTLRRQVVLVPQESKLLELTVAEAIAYPLKLQGLSTSAIKTRVTTWIDRMQIPSEWLDRTETELSLGQRQWVAIARALAMEPAVLLLDEPTSALDVGRAATLATLLRDLSETTNLTLLAVTHQLQFAQQVATRMIYLQAGAIVQAAIASEVDWQGVEQTLISQETQAAAEWDDEL